MKVLLTNRTLASRTGTEIVIRDLAVGLSEAGHEPCVFSPRLGPIANDIRSRGVKVVDRLDHMSFRPEIIHGQHQVETMLALAHFRNVPAIFVCHDRTGWHDSPPKLSAVRRYVAVDQNCLERLVIEAGIPKDRTRVIPNAVDLRRFRRRPALPAKAAKALVFSNYVVEGSDLQMLREAFAEAGLEMAVAGEGMAVQASQPEDILGDYDLVFAKGRCALEALGSGCAVILYDGQRLGPMVTGGQIRELRRWNLGRRCLQGQLTPDALRREIARYDPVDAGRVTDFIRTESSVEAAVAEYVRVYEEAMAEPGDVCVAIGDALESLSRNSGALESVMRSAGGPFTMPALPMPATAEVEVRVSDRVRRMAAGASTQIVVEIENRSAEVLASLEPFPVHVSYHWVDASDAGRNEFDGLRTPLTMPVRPRSRHMQEVRVLAPREPGHYRLVLTLVQEFQFWFDQLPQPVAVEWLVAVNAGPGGEPETRMLGEVAAWTSARVVRDGEFANLGFVSYPTARMLTFVGDRRFVAAALDCGVTSCVLTTAELADLFPERMALAVVADPKLCFFEIHNRLAMESGFYGKDFLSIIDTSAQVHPRCWVDEKNVIIHAGVRIAPNASVLGRAVLNVGATIHPGAVIGSAGFQTSHRNAGAIELVHAGTTEIGPDCHIFANAVIARGVFRQSTRIGKGCRVGNGAFVSHNCVLGDGVFIGHGAVVNGNVRIGANAWIGPGATVVHGVEIGEGAQVSLGATVMRDVQAGQRVTGSVAIEHRKMLRLMAKAEMGRET